MEIKNHFMQTAMFYVVCVAVKYFENGKTMNRMTTTKTNRNKKKKIQLTKNHSKSS